LADDKLRGITRIGVSPRLLKAGLTGKDEFSCVASTEFYVKEQCPRAGENLIIRGVAANNERGLVRGMRVAYSTRQIRTVQQWRRKGRRGLVWRKIDEPNIVKIHKCTIFIFQPPENVYSI
jgi:hypothetical protein